MAEGKRRQMTEDKTTNYRKFIYEFRIKSNLILISFECRAARFNNKHLKNNHNLLLMLQSGVFNVSPLPSFLTKSVKNIFQSLIKRAAFCTTQRSDS